MPLVQDYSEEEEDQAARVGGGGSGPGGGGGQSQSEATPQHEEAFVPWSRFVSANQDVSKREAGKLNKAATGAIDSAVDARNAASTSYNKGLESSYEHGGGSTAELQPGAFGANDALSIAGGFGLPSSANEALQQHAQPPPAPAEQAWSSFAPNSTKAGAGERAHVVPQRTGLTAGAVANGPSVAKSLEREMGADPWASLVGQTQAAQERAHALGSETGVQSLLQKQAGAPLAQGGAFDAALLYGQGQRDFQNTAKAGEGLLKSLSDTNANSENAWHSLMGDIDVARQRAAAETPGPGAIDVAPGDVAPGADSGGQWHPEGFTDLNSFMGGGNAEDYANHIGTSWSPLDQAWSWLGEQGAAQGRGITDRGNDYFSGQYGTAGAKTESVRDAFGKLSHDMGPAAAEYLWNHMTQDMWNLYLQMNSGEALRAMKQWLASSGFKAPTPGSSGGRASETTVAGGGGGTAAVAKEQGTSVEDETHRNEISLYGSYTDENGKTWTSVAEWDAAHRGSA